MWVRNNKGNVFVGNLPADFPDERLAETFDPFGIVLSAAVARDPDTGARLRYGFVDIATERAMTQAIAALDGSEVDGCKLNVKPRDKTAGKKPGAGPKRRPPLRTMRPSDSNGAGYDFGEPPRRPSPPDEPSPHIFESRPAPNQRSQSERAFEDMPEIEPPPRRDFEIVRRPVRRATPNFQVERRPLPRRV